MRNDTPMPYSNPQWHEKQELWKKQLAERLTLIRAALTDAGIAHAHIEDQELSTLLICAVHRVELTGLPLTWAALLAALCVAEGSEVAA